MFEEPKNCKSNYWLQTVILKKGYEKIRNELLDFTNSKGIETRPIWRLLSGIKYFKDCPSMNLENSKSLEKRIINLPSNELF